MSWKVKRREVSINGAIKKEAATRNKHLQTKARVPLRQFLEWVSRISTTILYCMCIPASLTAPSSSSVHTSNFTRSHRIPFLHCGFQPSYDLSPLNHHGLGVSLLNFSIDFCIIIDRGLFLEFSVVRFRIPGPDYYWMGRVW